MMQTASYFSIAPPLPASPQQGSTESLRVSVEHLLSKAHNLPCSKVSQAFSQLVQPTSRFQLALDALLPLLDEDVEVAERILASYILFSLYAPHPITINPFAPVLYATFVKETDRAQTLENAGGIAENDQFVYVLWKILKGDGKDIGPFSPRHILRHPIPPELRAAVLSKDVNTRSWRFDPQDDEAPSDGSLGSEAVSTFDQPNPDPQPTITVEDDRENETLSQGITLLLAARERVLTLSEQRILKPLLPKLTNPSVITSMDILPIITKNPSIATPFLMCLMTSSHTSWHGPSICFEALIHLPPTLTSFDIIGSLLRDQSIISFVQTGEQTTVGDLIRVEVLGYFIHECIEWLDNAEREEREGSISDDRFAKGVQNLCRFYHSLIKLSILDPLSSDEIDTTEMAHFTLRNSRFEDANALYRILVIGRF